MAPGALASTEAVIEYYNASQDHYFISSLPADITALDSGAIIASIAGCNCATGASDYGAKNQSRWTSGRNSVNATNSSAKVPHIRLVTMK